MNTLYKLAWIKREIITSSSTWQVLQNLHKATGLKEKIQILLSVVVSDCNFWLYFPHARLVAFHANNVGGLTQRKGFANLLYK